MKSITKPLPIDSKWDEWWWWWSKERRKKNQYSKNREKRKKLNNNNNHKNTKRINFTFLICSLISLCLIFFFFSSAHDFFVSISVDFFFLEIHFYYLVSILLKFRWIDSDRIGQICDHLLCDIWEEEDRKWNTENNQINLNPLFNVVKFWFL